MGIKVLPQTCEVTSGRKKSSLWDLRSLGRVVKNRRASCPMGHLLPLSWIKPWSLSSWPQKCPYKWFSSLFPSSSDCSQWVFFKYIKCDYVISYMAFFSGSQVPSGFYPKSSEDLQGPASFSFQPCLCLPQLSSSTSRMFPHMLSANPEEILLVLSAGHSLSSL